MIDLTSQVEGVLIDRGLIPPGETVLVAVSGGVDSLVLLNLLHRLSGPLGFRLAVAHFDHCLRGQEGRLDRVLVQTVAERMGWPCHCGEGDVRRHMAGTGNSVEMSARELRHQFLAETARSLGIRRIATAHHADDRVELFLMRLLRGAGSDGLTGLRWRSPSPVDPGISLVRPLLEIRKHQIEAHARDHGIQFREDTSNASPDILRNRVRHEVIPLLGRVSGQSAHAAILQTLEILAGDAAVAEAAAAAAGNTDFASLLPGIQRRLIARQLMDLGLGPEFWLIEELRLRPGTPVTVAPGMRLHRDPAGIVRHLAEEPDPDFGEGQVLLVDLAPAGSVEFGGLRLRWELREGAGLAAPMTGAEQFDAEALGPRVRFRHWRAGDRMQPLGMRGTVKLQDLFVNQKVPRPERHQRLVGETLDGQVFWVEDGRIGEPFKLTRDSRHQWRLSWSRTGC